MDILLPTNEANYAFGNKLKSLLTTIRSGLPYNVFYLKGFSELLQSDYSKPIDREKGQRLGCWRIAITHEEANILDHTFRDKYPEYWDCDYMPFLQIFSRTKTIDAEYERIPFKIKQSICNTVSSIPWSDTMRTIFREIDQQTQGKCILGVSVRSWQNPFETEDPLAKYRASTFDIRRYLQKIIMFKDNVDSIFLSFDREDLEQYFQSVEKRFYIKDSGPLVWSSLTPFQKIAAKCYMLSRCNFIILDSRSTFAEAAWFLGGCQASVSFTYDKDYI